MRVLTLAVSVLCLAACGGVETPDKPTGPSLAIWNDYAESIFTVDATFTGPGAQPRTVHVLSNERVARTRKDFADALRIQGREDTVKLDVETTSVGITNGFTATVRVAGHEDDTLVLLYDFDLATADFVLKYDWDSEIGN